MGLLVFLLLSKQGPLGSFKLLFTPTAMIMAQTLLLIPLARSLTLDLLNKLGEGILVLIATFSRGTSEVGAVMLVGGNIRGSTRVMTE